MCVMRLADHSYLGFLCFNVLLRCLSEYLCVESPASAKEIHNETKIVGYYNALQLEAARRRATRPGLSLR